MCFLSPKDDDCIKKKMKKKKNVDLLRVRNHWRKLYLYAPASGFIISGGRAWSVDAVVQACISRRAASCGEPKTLHSSIRLFHRSAMH